MKLSLRFFHTKIAQQYPDTSLVVPTNRMPTFSSLGILTPDMVGSNEVVYIDLIPHESVKTSSQLSIITTKSRRHLFKDCNRIVLSDETDLAEIVQLVSNTFTYYFGWADSIYEAIAKNMDLQTIMDLSAPIFGNPIYITDSSFKMLASYGGDFGEVNPTWRYQERYRYLPYEVMQNLIESGELRKLYNLRQAWLVENSTAFTALPFVSKAIRKEEIHYGNFYVIGFNSNLNECDIELADYLGMVLSTALYGNLNYLETSTLYHAHFLEDIIEGTMNDQQIMIDQLKALHWELAGDYVLALFDTAEDSDAIRHHMMALLTADIEAQCFVYQGSIVAILNNCTSRMEKVQKRLHQIARDFNRTAAISERFINFCEVSAYYAQARFTLDTIEGNEDAGKLFSYGDVFLEHLIEVTGSAIPVYGPAISLAQHDSACKTEYCLTLMTWLANERNTVRTAEILFIHRNTLKSRLERIRQIVGVDLDDFKVRERMALSLYQLSLAQTPR